MLLSIQNTEIKPIVDAKNYERLMKFVWYATDSLSFYRVERDGSVNRKGTPKTIHISLPNEVFQTRGLMYDHKDVDSINNLESNLRVCNQTLNNANRKKCKRKCSSQYKGVCWHKTYKLWYASIAYKEVSYHLGRFTSETEAALAYNIAAVKYFGEFAQLNIIC